MAEVGSISSESRTDEKYSWFQASSRGNGIGLTVLKSTESYDAESHLIFIYVLPKVWRNFEESDFRPKAWVMPLNSDMQTMQTLVLYEMDYLGLQERWAQALNNVCSTDVTGQSAESDDEGAKDALWTRSLSPRMDINYAGKTSATDLAGFWELIRTQLLPIVSDPPPGVSVLLSEPAAHEEFKTLFLRLAEVQVAVRKPEFVSISEALGAVRGRVLVNELIRRKASRSYPLWCEFDALEADNQIWQAIRHAVERCLQTIQGDGESIDLALEIDARLNDVSLSSVGEVVRRRPIAILRTGNRQLLTVYRMALAILNDQIMLGQPEDEVADGAVFTFKVATSNLWEQLIANAVNSTRNYRAIRKPGTKSLFQGGMGKEVDIHVATSDAHERTTLLIDGKYKQPVGGVTNSSMSDQYQIYAYANLWAAPGVLAYPSACDSLPTVRMVTALENRGSRAGIIHLPFPRPGQSKLPIEADTLEHLLDTIVAGTDDFVD